MDHILILSGGVGGAKLVEGFVLQEPASSLSVLANVGDDVERHGLWISPDVDILTYTIAGVVDRAKGWGFRGETFHVLEALERLGEATWMNLGDRDLATHILRTAMRRQGMRPTTIAQHIAESLGVKPQILIPTDEPLQTLVRTSDGWCNFQEYYVRDQCRPEVLDVQYEGAAAASATPEALAAIAGADLIVVAPSNPVASIGPILAVAGIREAVRASSALRVAVSPLVGGASLKGPSDRMMRAMGFTADVLGVGAYYRGFIDAMVIDEEDAGHVQALLAMGLGVTVTNTVMNGPADRKRLAGEVLELWREAATDRRQVLR